MGEAYLKHGGPGDSTTTRDALDTVRGIASGIRGIKDARLIIEAAGGY